MLFSWCGGVSGGVAVFWCSCDDVFVLFLWWCFFGGAVVFFCVVVFLSWCFCRGVVFWWWCGGVFMVEAFCSCDGGAHESKISLHYYGSPRHDRLCWSCHGDWMSFVWGWPRLQGQVNFALHDGTIVDSPSDTQCHLARRKPANARTPPSLSLH